GDASINNTAGGDINTGDQSAIADNGDAEITNETPGDLNVGEQVAIADGNAGTIDNNIGGEINPDPSPIITDEATTEPIFNPPNLDNNSTENYPAVPINTDNNNTTTLPPVVGDTQVPPIATPNNILQQLSTTPAGRGIARAMATQTPPPPRRNGERAIAPDTASAEIINSLNTTTTAPLATPAGEAVAVLEQSRSREFSQYLGTEITQTSANTASVRELLDDIQKQTGNRSAILYITVFSDNIELVVFTAGGEPLSKTVAGVSREELLKAIDEFRRQVLDPRHRSSKRYLKISQQLYEWLIAPVASELKANEIDTLLFSLDAGLRSLPIAALYDGEQFLVETYSLSLIPSISLTDTRYRAIQGAQLLAMGASEFSTLPALPAVPVELETIGQLWSGEAFLNQAFTRENLRSQRQERPYRIIHLATHAEFKSGDPGNSYIQLWGEEKLQLDQLRELGWNEPAVDLLVLSACRTALGDENAELGFAGLAVQAGVKSALASLWYVSDEGTLALMTEFYDYLSQATIKAEALRQAQLAMLRGEVVIQDGELRGTGIRGGGIQLPKTLANAASEDLSHPYYWAGFTLIGSPW
ncbi:MAG: CHAT domain-containing protein, partial [Limnospira sp.]